MSMTTKPEMQRVIRECCEANNVGYLAERISIEFNDRFTSRLGDANISLMRVRFSAPLWRRASVKERTNTVAHEACHLIARHKFGRRIKSHGGEWRACMLVAGYSPTRCHSVSTAGLRKSHKTCRAVCGCTTHMVTPKKFAAIAQGAKWTCRNCHGKLRIPGM